MSVNWGSLIVLIIIAGLLGAIAGTVAPESVLLPVLVGATYGWLHGMSWPILNK